MSARLKANLEIKQFFLKNLQEERDKYLILKDKCQPKDSRYHYYDSCIFKRDKLIKELESKIDELKKEIEACAIKQIFSKPRMTGIEYRNIPHER